MEFNSPPLEFGLDLVTSSQTREYIWEEKKKEKADTGEKPDQYYLNEIIKVHIISSESVAMLYP